MTQQHTTDEHMKEQALSSFRTKRFLVEVFGTTQGLLSFLRSYDAPLPGAFAVEKWFKRESIPSGWLVILLAYLEVDRGGPISLIAYLEREVAS